MPRVSRKDIDRLGGAAGDQVEIGLVLDDVACKCGHSARDHHDLDGICYQCSCPCHSEVDPFRWQEWYTTYLTPKTCQVETLTGGQFLRLPALMVRMGMDAQTVWQMARQQGALVQYFNDAGVLLEEKVLLVVSQDGYYDPEYESPVELTFNEIDEYLAPWPMFSTDRPHIERRWRKVTEPSLLALSA